MRIGILAYRQKPFISANTAIAYVVGEQLAKTEEVVFIGRKQDVKQHEGDAYNNIKISYLNRAPKHGLTWCGNKLVRLGMMRLAFREETKALRRITKEEKIDALICMTAPNDDAFIAISAGLRIPVYLYQLDPFYNHGGTDNPRLKRLFKKYLLKFKHVFTTALLMTSYKQDEQFTSLINKISVVQFPKLTEHKNDPSVTNKSVRLLYAGSLYAGRKHSFLIELKQAIPQDGEVVFCGICEKEQDLLELKQAGVLCLGYCDPDRLNQEIQKASILVNIGNTVRNQLPSKVIDYISTGKPIINIMQIDQCPTLDILRSYDYCFNLFGDDIAGKRQEITDFIEKTHGRIIPWEKIRSTYNEYTPEFVATAIMNEINGSYSHVHGR